MHMKLRYLACVTLLAFGPAHAALPEPVAKLAAAAGIPDEAIGAMVLRDDTVLVSNEADTPMQPASAMKVVTAVVGLEELGPVFRGRTELRSKAPVVGGVLQGDLVIRGGADLDFNEDALVHLLEKLHAQGIHRIAGDLLLDRQLFQPARADTGVAPFDEAPEAYYNVIPDALLLNMNLLHVDMDSMGKGVRLAMLPELDDVTIRSEQVPTDGDCAKWEDGWKLPTYERTGKRLTVVLHGTFPRNCKQSYAINVLDRDDYAGRLVRATWKRLGGSIAGTTRPLELAAHTSDITAAAAAQGAVDGNAAPKTQPAGTDYDGTRLLAQHVSRMLPELVRDTLKVSDNTMARTIFLSLGSLQPDPVLGSRPLPAGERLAMLMAQNGAADTGVPASTQARAEQVIRRWMKQHGIDDAGLVLENGSGLSRKERISAVQLAAVLRGAQESLWSPEFESALPIVGVDGTMRRRLTTSSAAQRARIKTGTMKNVVAVAGFVPDANGEQCIVVAFVNHEHAGDGVGRRILDALIDWTANSSAASAM